MPVNTFLDFQFDSSGLNIEHIFYCDKTLRREVELSHLYNFHSNCKFSFGFNNLCKLYPNRIVIFSEDYSPYCESEWFNRSSYNLLRAYSRIYSVYKTLSNVTTITTIDYTTQYYIDSFEVRDLENGLQLLKFDTKSIYSSPYPQEGEQRLNQYPHRFLFYPVLFTGGMAYNPSKGFIQEPYDQSSIETYFGSRTVRKYHNESGLRFRLFGYDSYSEFKPFPNIDLSYFSVGDL